MPPQFSDQCPDLVKCSRTVIPTKGSNMNNTASVTTLTATVDTLTMNGRQVTLSVARQLDHVSLDDMEPMGRVRTGSGVYAIGRHNETGKLVLGSPFAHSSTCDDLDWCTCMGDHIAIAINKLELLVLAGLK